MQYLIQFIILSEQGAFRGFRQTPQKIFLSEGILNQPFQKPYYANTHKGFSSNLRKIST
jgi:hypothetical protein